MTAVRSPSRAIAPALFAAATLLASACGGDSATGAGSSAQGSNAASAADDNIGDLATNEDVRLIEVLEVDTGETTTLADTVTGDRPVLLWFWAPH